MPESFPASPKVPVLKRVALKSKPDASRAFKTVFKPDHELRILIKQAEEIEKPVDVSFDSYIDGEVSPYQSIT